MRILGVLDLLEGRAVHARGGDRRRYEPVRAVAGFAIESGDACALARIYRDCYHLIELYVADLDAIARCGSQDEVVSGLAAGGAVWLDAGVSSIAGAHHAFALGVSRAIIGLETLESWNALREIVPVVGAERVAFSLDLRNGEPLSRVALASGDAAAVAARAVEAGIDSIIVIDLARVGAGAGLDLELIGRVRDAVPEATLLAGGGVREFEDVERLAGAGCDGVLVASALHDGRLSAADVAAAQRIEVRR
jgi:phosphoribosylformimino-5-aminoimidazole carboxamide ribotide isomerase